MTDPTCSCGQPIWDTAYVCTKCQARLRWNLQDLQRLAGEGATTIARLGNARTVARILEPEPEADSGWHKGKSALFPTRLPVDLDRARRYDAAVGELLGWVRHIEEERGHCMVLRERCSHAVCRREQTSWPLIGPVCAAAEEPPHPLAQLVDWLAGNVVWLAHRPEAEEAFDKIDDACHQIERVIDSSSHAYYGTCGCGTDLNAREDASKVKCKGCGTEYDPVLCRAALLEAARERVVTAAEAAELIAGYVEPNADRQKVRKLVWAWADRDHIAAVTEEPKYKGPPRYELGPILDRWTRALAARAA